MSEGLEEAHQRIAAERHRGDVTWISMDRKEMKISMTLAGGKEPVVDSVYESDAVRIAYDIKIKDKVRLKIKDFWSAAWEKDDQASVVAADAAKKIGSKKRKLLDSERLIGTKGFGILLKEFPKLKFNGPAYETPDLHKLVSAYRDWAYGLESKYNFHRVVRRVEILGCTKPVKGAVFDMRMSNYGNGYDEDEDEWVDSDDPDYDRKMKEREQRRLAAKHTEGQGNLEKENEVPETNSGVVAHADKRAKTSRGVGGAVAGGQNSAYDEAEPELAFEQEEAHREPDIDEDLLALEQDMWD